MNSDNQIWAVLSEYDQGVIAIFNNHAAALQYIKQNDEDEWWYLAFYNGDTGRYMGKQDRRSGLW
jgi:hypothetical protein